LKSFSASTISPPPTFVPPSVSRDIGMASDRGDAIAARQTRAALVRLVRARRHGWTATARIGGGQ
jgi:hypothetical protein